jgi:hypothetical protein
MDAAPSGVRSFDELAKICLKSTYWPAESAMQHRSLGAILGRLDRGEGIDWLAARPEAQRALSELLGVPRGSLMVALQPKKGRAPERWVSWSSMPLARGLDLLEEPLFPGIPDAVLHPGAWDRLIWVAPNGAGRSLVGQWLAARGLAEWRSLPDRDLRALPQARPLLVELGATEIPPELVAAGVCVAVPEPWEPTSELFGYTVVRTPRIGELVEPLVRWACERLSGSSRVHADELVGDVRALIEAGLVVSAGDVLGIVGLADVETPEVLDVAGVERAARGFLRRRGRERLDPEAPEFGWLRRAGFETLVALARRVTTEAEAPLFCGRTIEAWSDLLPESARHGPDLEWLKVALPQADPSVRLATIERASEKLPPGAFRVLRCFEHLGVLAREGESLALRPHWLVRVAEHRALEDLVTGPSFDWGEALLSPRMAVATMDRLVASALLRKLPVDELVEPSASADPGYAAAVEGAVRALGAAELADVHLGGEALEPLWDEQLRLAMTLPDGAIAPRIEHAPSPRSGGFWLSRGAWLLAVLAVSEALDRHLGKRHALLRPWHATEPPEGLGAVLDEMVTALERPDAPADVLGPAIGLVSRLGATLGPLGLGRVRHRLERAATVADEAAVGVLAWSSVAALAGDRLARLGLAYLVTERRLEHAVLGRQVWQAFEAAGMPESEADALLTPELAPLVMPSAPSSVLPALLPALLRCRETPVLTPAQWQALLGGALGAAPAELFARVPETLVDLAIDAACRAGHRSGLAVLWGRSSRFLTLALVDWLLAPRPADTRRLLLETTPPRVTPEVLERLPNASALLRGPLGSLEAVRRFLHARVAERGPGFRDAYALLDELEGRLSVVRSQPPPG